MADSHADQRKRPLRVYSVEEKLIGTAYYQVTATSAKEAGRIFKERASQFSMIDSDVDHTGQLRVRWDRSESPVETDETQAERNPDA